MAPTSHGLEPPGNPGRFTGLAGYDYTYDGVGNRLTQVRRSTSNTTTNYTYNADDQMTAAGSTAYTYSVNGNQATAGARSFTYDLENRLRTTTQGSTTHTYSYDGDGNRLKDSWGTTAATNVNYLWDVNGGLPLLAIERNGNNALLRRYTYGSRLLAESTTASNAFYYLGDPIGSTANLVNSSGTTMWTYTYEPYGATRSATNGGGAPTNLMRFNGQLIDTVDNLYNLRARMYDPATGRFLQQDPVGNSITAPSIGAYAYTGDRPTALTDPSGACPICIGFLIGALIGGLSYGGVVATTDWAWDWRGFGASLLGGGIIGAGCVALSGACASVASRIARAAGPLGATCVARCDRMLPTASQAAALVRNAESVGSSLKADAFHRAASFVVDEINFGGVVFKHVSEEGVPGYLIQVLGGLNGSAGRYEWIVTLGGQLTHSYFVKGGSINGIPIVP